MSSRLPIDTLGQEIKARIDAGDKAAGKAEDHYIAAGLQLAEARRRVAGEGTSFQMFLDKHGIGKSRAYEILAVTDGTKTFAGIRAKAAERAAKHAANNREARSSVSNGHDQDALRSNAPIGDRAALEIEALKKEHERTKKALADAKGRLSVSEGHAESVRRQRDELETKYRFASSDKERLEQEIEALKKKLKAAEDKANEANDAATMNEALYKKAEKWSEEAHNELLFERAAKNQLNAVIDELNDEIERLKEDGSDFAHELIETYYGAAQTWRGAFCPLEPYQEGVLANFLAEKIARVDLIKMVESAAYGRINDFHHREAFPSSYEIGVPKWQSNTQEFHDIISKRVKPTQKPQRRAA